MKRDTAFAFLAIILLFLLFAACADKTAPMPELIGLSIDSSNAHYWYVSGEELDSDGLIITAEFSDGSTREIHASDCTFDKPPFAPYGEKEVVVHYGDLTARYPIYVCTSSKETPIYTNYTVRKNENGTPVTLTAALVGENKPFVLILPGGGYTSAIYSGQEGAGYAEYIRNLGWNAFVLEYSTKMQHPAPLEDISLALEIIEQNKNFFSVSMDSYAVCGSSAGGHLAASWCTKAVGYAVYEKPRPATAILVYPVISFLDESDGETQRNLLGDEPSDELRHLLSVQEHVDGDYPPTYVWVFVEDGLKTNAELMEKALEDAGVEHVARYFTGGRHGIGLAEGTEAEGWLTEAVAFWQDHIN